MYKPKIVGSLFIWCSYTSAARHNGFTNAQLIAEITGALEALR